MAAFIAFAIAQIAKVFTYYYTENRWDPTRIIGSGGMPSSHTSMVRESSPLTPPPPPSPLLSLSHLALPLCLTH